MSLHINRFIDRIRTAETRGQRDIVIGINEAKELHTDITKLLLALETLRQAQQPVSKNNPSPSETVEIEVQGGSF